MTQSEIKFAKSLQSTKNRRDSHAYLVEGAKLVQEWMKSDQEIIWIICTEEYFNNHKAELLPFIDKIKIVAYFVLEKISTLKTAPLIMAVVSNSNHSSGSIDHSQSWHIVLDRIQDPGNLGTIIRLADWMGIKEIIVSPNSVDVYNPKVIQSTMGSFLRVQVVEMDLSEVILLAKKPLIGTILSGENILEFEKRDIDSGYIFMGNESHGLPEEIIKKMDYTITLPSLNSQAESLNVAIATSMICSRLLYK